MNDLATDIFLKVYGIQRLLEDLNIEHIQKSNANNLIMRCPFHDDQKPSFSINVENGLFTCFGCSESGNLQLFIKKAYSLSSADAHDFILTKSGLKDGNIENLLFLHEVEKNLKTSEHKGQLPQIEILDSSIVKRMYEEKDPYDYLLGRGFTQRDIDYFECGYTEHYNGINYSINKRITIPGHDEYGNICGFIGRTPINVEPKYLYTLNYPKSHTLFNLHRAKKYSDKGLIIVEGSLDVMRVHSLGYPNVVAILGAKMSQVQKQLVLKYTDKVYLMCDNDKAGKQANFQALKDLSSLLKIYYVDIPSPKKDPGEITNSNELTYLLDTAKSFSEFEMMQGLQNGKKNY